MRLTVEIPRVPRAASMRRAGPALSLLVALSAGVALFGQHTRDVPATTDAAPAGTSEKSPAPPPEHERRGVHLREGTEIRDVSGRIRLADGRFEFASHDGQYRLKILENLALERAARKSAEGTQGVAWKVSGVVTEFESGNYLLVRRIVVDDSASE